MTFDEPPEPDTFDGETLGPGESVWKMPTHEWYVHYVPPRMDSNLPDYHTHGFPDTFGHPDLQIVFPLDPQMACDIFARAVMLIESRGRRFEDGFETQELLGISHGVLFVSVREEGNRPTVLRIILPDRRGSLEVEQMEPHYARQWVEP